MDIVIKCIYSAILTGALLTAVYLLGWIWLVKYESKKDPEEK
jgi:hypothetical protein